MDFVSSILDPVQRPVLVGVAAFVFLVLAEKSLDVLGFCQPKARKREELSFLVVILPWYGAVVFSLFDAMTLHWTTVGPGLSLARYLGVPFLVAGIACRVAARLTLGKQFSGHVQTTERHELITSGIYSSVRHPAYLGYLSLLIGFPLCFGSIAGLVFGAMAGTPAVVYRIRVEEAALLRWFGEEYQRYIQRTSRLIPLLW